MKTNIVVVSLLDEKSKEVATKLATDYDLYFADVDEILQYDLFNADEIKKKCGVKYLNSLKDKIIKDLSMFENTMIYIPFGLFLKGENAKLLKLYGTAVFLNFEKAFLENKIKDEKNVDELKNLKVQEIAFEDRAKICQGDVDVSINIEWKDNKNIYKKIKKALDNYLL